jgi:hypothetical protein
LENYKVRLNDVLESVLTQGNSSSRLNDFIQTCLRISCAYFKASRFKEFVRAKTGCSDIDLAYDFIADLFEENDGIYFRINSFFRNSNGNVIDMPEDMVKAKLASLVCSATNQRISEIREDFGENYFKIKKAVDICLERNGHDFKKIVHRNILYVQNSLTTKVNFSLSPFPPAILLENLHGLNFRTRNIPEVLRGLFSLVDNQEEYCKALEFTRMVNYVVDYFKQRFNDFIYHH